MVNILGVLISAFVAVSAVADPPVSPKNHWRNTNYYSHYFLYEKSTNTWVETVDCKALWRFTKASSSLNELILYDASRKLSVKLSYTDMFLKYDNEANWKFYQKGTFSKRVRFFHEYNGQWTGTLSRKNACQWEERFPGTTAPTYFFKAYAEDAGSVLILDGSRNMRVKLTEKDMFLQGNGQTAFGFFKSGYWSEY